MVERWLPIPGHDDYEISDHGRVRSYKNGRNGYGPRRLEPRLLMPITKHGYLWIKLGRKFQGPVHLLVIRTFIGPAPDGMECRHLDGNRQNARLDNLTYGTKAENYADRRLHGTANDGERHGNAKLTNAQAGRIRISEQPTVELADFYKVSRGTICKIRNGSAWRTTEDTLPYAMERVV